MQDFQLYQKVLGLTEPWRVKQVTLDRQSGEVRIEVECTETVWGCPQSHSTVTSLATGRSGPVRMGSSWPRKGVSSCDSSRAMWPGAGLLHS